MFIFDTVIFLRVYVCIYEMVTEGLNKYAMVGQVYVYGSMYYICACVRVCVCACVRVCVWACVRVRASVHACCVRVVCDIF